jgi:coenzyme F420-0:L-glutamate ligase/coenzyme F420-1:gamma-L-glutamate ligase
VISNQLAILELMSTRHSIRRFTPQAVEEAVLERLLQAACRAPSAHNRQPWRFVVVREDQAKQRLAEAMSAAFAADLRRDGLGDDQISEQVDRRSARILAAPVMVVLCLTMEAMDTYPDPVRQDAEHTMAVQSVALAGGHLLLATHAEGLGGCWICSPLFAPVAVRETLALPLEWEPQGMILIGHPADGGRDRSRKPWEDLTLWR